MVNPSYRNGATAESVTVRGMTLRTNRSANR